MKTERGAKTSQNARFLLSENERFGLVFVKTGSINTGKGEVRLCNICTIGAMDRRDFSPTSSEAENFVQYFFKNWTTGRALGAQSRQNTRLFLQSSEL
jgi:hypothetical protein